MCTGEVKGSGVVYQPSMAISDKYRTFVVTSARFAVCGAESIVPGGQTYRLLVKKYGTPVQKPTDIARGQAYLQGLFQTPINPDELFFRIGDWSLSARSQDAGDDDRSLGCDHTLQFETSNTRAGDEFSAHLAEMDRARAARVKPNF